MPFAAVLTRGQSTILSPPVAVSARKGISGRGLCPHATASCQSTSPQRTPSRNPASSPRTLCGPQPLHVILISSVLRHVTRLLGRDNACPWPAHLLTVEMIPGPAPGGPLL